MHLGCLSVRGILRFAGYRGQRRPCGNLDTFAQMTRQLYRGARERLQVRHVSGGLRFALVPELDCTGRQCD